MRTLLLADDNITVQRVIVLTFAQEPVRVVTVSDGHQAMDRVVVERPDIVLVGTTLPYVNGYDLARFVKSKAESKDVPVLLLSGAFESIDEAQLLSSGANGVIEKPVEPTAIIKRVKELLGLMASEPGPALGRLVTAATATAGQRPMQSPTMPRAVTTSRPMPPVGEPPRDRMPDLSAASVEDTTGRDDYLESLGDAFDTLDQQLAGRQASTQYRDPPRQRNQPDRPRSPGRVPPAQAAAPPPAQPVYEVDDEWFAEDQKARDTRQLEQRELAREMGIHEVEWPESGPIAPPTADEDLECGEADPSAVIATGPDEPPTMSEPPPIPEPPKIIEAPTSVDVRQSPELMTPIVEVALASAAAPGNAEARVQRADRASVIEMTLSVQRDEEGLPIEPVARTLPIDLFAASGTKERRPVPAVAKGVVAPPASATEVPHVTPAFLTSTNEPRRDVRDVADDFEALLAFEQGAKAAPPMIEPIIHAVTPEITSAMLEEIATTLADRLKDHVRVEPVAPEITGDIVKTIALLVAGSLTNSIRVEPAAPEITVPMLEQISGTLADRLKDSIRVEPLAPQISFEMLETMAYLVSAALKDHIRVEPAAPVITEAIVDQIATTLSERLAGSVHVEARAPEISGEMLDRVAGTMADRLKDSIRVEPVAPEISDAMLERVAEHVSARLKDSIRVEPAIPELNGSMLDHIAGTVAARLTDTVRESVRVETVAPAISIEMLDHVAARVSERLQSSLPPPVAPQITDDMLERVAGRVAERMQGSLSIDHLRDSITAAIRDTVRAVVSETSERLVREEIERIKSRPHG